MLGLAATDEEGLLYHEDSPTFITRQQNAVQKLKAMIESRINPFTTSEKKLLNIFTSEPIPDDIASGLLSLRQTGITAVEKYLRGDKTAFSKVKVKNAETVKIWKKASKAANFRSVIIAELQTVKRLLLSVDSAMDGGLERLKDLLSYELLPYSPALFERSGDLGDIFLRSGAKSPLLDYIRCKAGLELA
jgi:hypothetical protein